MATAQSFAPGITDAAWVDVASTLFPELAATVADLVAGTTPGLEMPLPQPVADVSLRIAAALSVLTGYRPFISAADDGTALVTVRVDPERMLYVEVGEDAIEAVLSVGVTEVRNLKVASERELLREAVGLMV